MKPTIDRVLEKKDNLLIKIAEGLSGKVPIERVFRLMTLTVKIYSIDRLCLKEDYDLESAFSLLEGIEKGGLK